MYPIKHLILHLCSSTTIATLEVPKFHLFELIIINGSHAMCIEI